MCKYSRDTVWLKATAPIHKEETYVDINQVSYSSYAVETKILEPGNFIKKNK